ncbi:hypothetical protein [Streptomyces sp. NBC_00470]|uniref:hypothetical protein n=1 Tax=Streptomyces sp. NBC_00470 TaxID=2975753 RepID=UPI0030E22D1D
MTSPLTIRTRPAWKGWPLFHYTYAQELSVPYRRSSRVLVVRFFNRRIEFIHWNLPPDGMSEYDRERLFFREISEHQLNPPTPAHDGQDARPPA